MSEMHEGKTPLFPLGRPLYPGVALKLRIFEQRYLKLVRDSMASGRPFGIVPITRGREVGAAPEIFPWGTLVTIVDFDQQPDGLLGITISGNRRFRVQDHDVQGDGLVVAEIELLDAEPDDPTGPAEQDLTALLDDLVVGLGMREFFPGEAPSLAALSWRLATLLPLAAETKLALLRENDPHIRLDMLRECLVELTAAGNGGSGP